MRQCFEASDYLEREEWLLGSAKQPLIDSAEEMLSDKQGSKVDLAHLPISDIGLSPDVEIALLDRAPPDTPDDKPIYPRTWPSSSSTWSISFHNIACERGTQFSVGNEIIS